MRQKMQMLVGKIRMLVGLFSTHWAGITRPGALCYEIKAIIFLCHLYRISNTLFVMYSTAFIEAFN